MGFRVDTPAETITVSLSGIDRVLNLRSLVEIDRADISRAWVVPRSEIEPEIDHRMLGVGSHVGVQGIGGRRVGTMMGRAVVGRQFWAVSSGGADASLVVVDLSGDHEFSRLVLEVERPDDLVTSLVGDRP